MPSRMSACRLWRGSAGLAGLLVLVFEPSAARAMPVEYGLTYLSVPAEIDYVVTDLSAGTLNAQAQSASFGSIGFRIGVGIPASLGPFTAGVETGFGIPAGSQAFDHQLTVENTGGMTLNAKHTGDFTTWSVLTIPMLFALKYSRPSDSVSFGGQFGLGPVLLGIQTQDQESVYDATGGLLTQTTTTSNAVEAAFVIDLEAGLVIPASDSLRLRVMGGLLWVSEVDQTTVQTGSPNLVFGGGYDQPGLRIGGLGVSFRAGLETGF